MKIVGEARLWLYRSLIAGEPVRSNEEVKVMKIFAMRLALGRAAAGPNVHGLNRARLVSECTLSLSDSKEDLK
jgi:hypothetical protein